MKFGVVFPNAGEYVDVEYAVAVARAAEEHGFDAFLVWDHYMLPGSKATFEAFMLLSHLASKTSRIRLGTCVTPIPLRPPTQLAKATATLDQLSGGRLILGVGAGWHRPEFEGFGSWEPGNVRFERTEEALRLILRLWIEKEVSFKGRFYAASGAVVEPKPKQKPHPQLWFGSTGTKMLGLAAELGTGWVPTLTSPSDYSAMSSKLRLTHRNPDFTFAYDQYDPLQTAAEYAESIAQYQEGGCDYYLVNWKYSKEEALGRLAWFEREVMKSFE